MRTALITGASGGLGQAICATLAQAGHDLVVHYSTDAASAEKLSAAVTAMGQQAWLAQADLAVPDVEASAAGLVAESLDALGHLDVVVLNASSQELTAWDDLDAATWDRLYTSTLRHTAVLLRVAAAAMDPTRKPAIVVVGSIEGERPAPGHGAYAVFKAATHHLVRVAAQELGPRGIRVVGVAPGLIDRPGLAEQWPDGFNRWAQATALRRPVSPAEVAEVIAFAASPHASGLTGITIPVDAGWSASPGW
jgi:3-oxoacyl-[acyl-carrier protein] reductase